MTRDSSYYRDLLRNMFEALDSNCNGFIEFVEFKIHMLALNVNDSNIIKSAFNSIGKFISLFS